MFGLGPLEISIGIAIFLLCEVALFWAAAALGDAPELGFGKTLFVALLVAAGWCGINVAIGWSSGIPAAPLAAENRMTTIAFSLVALGVSWLVSTVLYVPLIPVSIGRSMLISVFQVLLRAFLYVLLIAVIMLILAVVQIWSGTDVRTELPSLPAIPLCLFLP
jgi:hypothetical protein